MFNTKHIYPKVIVFAPTNSEKHDYDGIVPKELIYEEFNLENIRNIYSYQKAGAYAYNIANKVEILQSLFDKIASPQQKNYLHSLTRQKEIAEKTIIQRVKNIGDRKTKLAELEKVHSNKLRSFYKQRIVPNTEFLKNQNLTKEEQLALKFINYNPRILVIFDDAMTEILQLLKTGRKNNDDVILDFFYKGRHAYITHFYALQDDNKVPSEIKKNAMISTFFSPNTAQAFFTRGATNFSKQERAKADAAIRAIFSDDDDAPKHRKLVYNRLDPKNPFQYTIANLHDNFEMCSPSIREYCKRIAKTEDQVDKSNPYLKRFVDS